MDSHSGLIILTMLILSAFFSGIEIAFLSSNKLRIELKNKQGVWWGRILSNYLKRPSRFISTVLVGNNVALVVYGIFMEEVLHFWFDGAPWAAYEFLDLMIQTFLSTLLILIFAEFLPKVIFNQKADTLLPTMIFPFQLFYYLLLPIVNTVNWLAERFLNMLPGGETKQNEMLFTKVDLDHYITDSVNIYTEEDSELDTEVFRNALDFDQVKVRECMVPRNEVVAVELNDSIEELWSTFIESGHSKILVYKESVDNIIGYVHQIDLFQKPESIKSCLIPIVIATESMPANELLKKFTANRKSLAVVVDEFGGTAGIVTIEDILEEIFGEIEDEHDVEDLLEEQISEKEYRLSARLEVDYLNETYDLGIPEGDYETLGGFVIARYESIPEKGETLVIDPFEFHILSLENARIGNVRLRILDK
ncbi:MAG: hemolysin family protein [Bacteroidota bacterium]|nr:hemolysin family protein [Bacteroidota bacterium]MDX5430052.1 hemolysin family protein [Bacteroidota bacterium]MDX5468822.1 hemolysin family protein [Bacteroidota bacterium]